MDFASVPSLVGCAENIARWADRYAPPGGEADARLAEFPYLAPDYSLTERHAGRTPWLRDIHLFGIATTLSFGPAGASINAMVYAVPRLVRGLVRGLFEADLPRLWQSCRAYDEPITRIAEDRIASD
jgi:hypothetical protein